MRALKGAYYRILSIYIWLCLFWPVGYLLKAANQSTLTGIAAFLMEWLLPALGLIFAWSAIFAIESGRASEPIERLIYPIDDAETEWWLREGEEGSLNSVIRDGVHPEWLAVRLAEVISPSLILKRRRIVEYWIAQAIRSYKLYGRRDIVSPPE